MTDTWLWLLAFGLLLNGFVALGARALREFSRHELEALCHRRNNLARFGEILRRHDDVGLVVEMLRMVCVAGFAIAAAYAEFSQPDESDRPWLGPTLRQTGVLLLLLAAVNWVPAALARLWAAPFLYHTWPLWRFTRTLMTPFWLCARVVDAFLHRLAGRTPQRFSEETFEEEIRSIVTEGHREGLLEEDAREMIESVIELGDADVSEVMTPRTDMLTLQVDTPWLETVQFVVQSGHARIPVYDKNRDDIIGILYGKDVLRELARPREQDRQPLRAILRQPYFVPETKPVDALLQEFQQTGNHMAIVLDEYGGVSGLVTIEDVLEEIVGEIIDEYDEAVVEEIKRLDDRTSEALARAHIDEINEALDVSLPDDGDFDTIGGLVMSRLGRVPVAGEQLVLDNVRITVLEATRRRIDRVRLESLNEVGGKGVGGQGSGVRGGNDE